MTAELITKPIAGAATPVAGGVGQTLVEFWHGLIGDRIVAWRLNNAASLNEKLSVELSKRGVTLNTSNLPLGMAFRWFEKATETDEEEIQTLFAKILASASEGIEDALRKRNIDLVSSMSLEEARFLEFVKPKFEAYRDLSPKADKPFSISSRTIYKELKDSEFNYGRAIDTVISIGIFHLDRTPKGSQTLTTFGLTHLNRSLDNSRPDIGSLFEIDEKLILSQVGSSLLEALYPKKIRD